ncbi:ATP-binding cassette long-chain fatty acid transporter pxa2, partial [Coemansia sp. RSA 2671]
MVAAVNHDLLFGAATDKIHSALYKHVLNLKHKHLAVLAKVAVLYVKHQKTVKRSIVALIFLGIIERIHKIVRLMTAERKLAASSGGGKERTRRGAQLDKQFFENMKQLIAIAIPGLFSKETGILVAHTVLLVFRTFLSVVVASLDGQIVSSLVRLQGREFLTGIAKWMAMAVPATLTNSLLNYVQTMLAIRFRQNLTEH